MVFHPQSLPSVPAATAAIVRAAFPKGNLYVDLREEFGLLYDDPLFADLYSAQGPPVVVAPWRLMLVTLMQYIEGLTDRQAADAVRRCVDWKYALSLELTDPGFDFTLLHDFRARLLASGQALPLLDTVLNACKARGWIKARGQQRTDSTHVLAAIRTLDRLENVLETLHLALNRCAAVDPAWVQAQVPTAWYVRYGPRADAGRLPKEASKRAALAAIIGADGFQLLAWASAPEAPAAVRTLPALQVLRQVWLQQYYRCTFPDAAELRWRTAGEQPPSAQLIQSPYDLEARYSTKRETHWVGYKVHVSETCDPEQPCLITQVVTTPATTQDSVMGQPLQDDLAQRDLLPSVHLLDQGYVNAELLVAAATQHEIDVVGPVPIPHSPQAKAGAGYALQAFRMDWEHQQAQCPQGHRSVKWSPDQSGTGQALIRIRFDRATCRVCPVRTQCTTDLINPRQLTVRPQAQQEALEAQRARQERADFRQVYAERAGIESCLSQGTRRFELRRTRYRGLRRASLQNVLVAVAMNLVRIGVWLQTQPAKNEKRASGQFARLAPA